MPHIFKLNECDWVAAETLEDAITSYLAFTGGDRDDDAYIDEPWRLTSEDLDRHMFVDDDGTNRRTFRVRLQELIDQGETFPTFFASTEY